MDIIRRTLVTLFTIYFFVLFVCRAQIIKEVKRNNFEEYRKGKFIVLTYVDSISCSRCRILYPYFVAAAQGFNKDPEIFFSRTYDKQLVSDWNVEELPAIVYHKVSKAKTYIMKTDITVPDIIDGIARTIGGDFDNHQPDYTVRLTPSNYDELATTPPQSVLVLIHDKKSKKEKTWFEEAAHNFRYDEGILFCTLNLQKHEELRNERFKNKDVPAVMYLKPNDKKYPKRYGGFLMHERLIDFVNEITNISRNYEGQLTSTAGRIVKAEIILKEYLAAIFTADDVGTTEVLGELTNLKSDLDPHHHEMLKFYSFVVNEIVSYGTPILKSLEAALNADVNENSELTRKERDGKRKKLNILKAFKEMEDTFFKEGGEALIKESKKRKHMEHEEL